MAAVVIACFALKGGVGKTSAAVNLATLSARAGHRTLLWDLDPQGAASFLFRVKPKVRGGTRKLLQGKTDPRDALKSTNIDGLDLLPGESAYQSADVDLDAAKKSELRVRRVLDAVADDYDVVVLDSPPGSSLLSTNVVRAASLLLVPLIPSPLSLRTLDQTLDLTVQSEPVPKFLAFFSMVEGRRALHRDVIALVGDRYADVARAQVPASATIERMGQRRAPVVLFAPRTRAAESYLDLWGEV